MLLLFAVSAFAAVDGTVTNGTTEKPQAGAIVQLYKLGQAGPEFMAAGKSDAQGHFSIDQNLAPGPHLLMTSYAGVNYNKMLTPGQPTTGVAVTVYDSSAKPGQARVAGHTLLLEPSTGQVRVTESFFYSNPGKVTYSNPAEGTLRFELPKGADAPQVRVTEPGGMPIQREPDKTKTAGLYKLDFPIKPGGDTEFDVTYTAPLASSGEFSGKVLYPTSTRFAVPGGVSMEAEGLKPLGQEPQSQANLYEIDRQAFKVKLTGTGSLQTATSDQGDDGAPTMSVIVPPGFAKQQTKILVMALVVLALGFVLLYRKGRAA